MTDQEADIGYVRLATAIIELASYDYRNAMIREPLDGAPGALLKNTWPYDEAAENCKSFFLGPWFGVLSMSEMEGKDFLRLLDQDIQNGYRKAKKQFRHWEQV